MEESVSEVPNEIFVSFLTLSLAAKGGVAFLVAAPVGLLILAFAWRTVFRKL